MLLQEFYDSTKCKYHNLFAHFFYFFEQQSPKIYFLRLRFA